MVVMGLVEGVNKRRCDFVQVDLFICCSWFYQTCVIPLSNLKMNEAPPLNVHTHMHHILHPLFHLLSFEFLGEKKRCTYSGLSTVKVVVYNITTSSIV